MKLKFEIEEGNVLTLNDKVWVVIDVDHTLITMESHTTDPRVFSKEELEELIFYSGYFAYAEDEYYAGF